MRPRLDESAELNVNFLLVGLQTRPIDDIFKGMDSELFLTRQPNWV